MANLNFSIFVDALSTNEIANIQQKTIMLYKTKSVYRTKNLAKMICHLLNGFDTMISSVLFSSFSLKILIALRVENIIEQTNGTI